MKQYQVFALVFILGCLWYLVLPACSSDNSKPPTLPSEEGKTATRPAKGVSKGLTLIRTITPSLTRNQKGELFRSPIGPIAESPDGKLLAISDTYNVVLYSLQDKNKRLVIHHPLGMHTTKKNFTADDWIFAQVVDMRFRNNSTLLWKTLRPDTEVWQASIRNWKVKDKKKVRLKKKVVNFSGMAFDDILVVSTAGKTLGIIPSVLPPKVLEKYDLKTGAYLSTCKIYPQERGEYHEVEKMAISPDHKLIAILSDCNSGIVQVKPFKLVNALGVKYGTQVAFSPDGSRIAIGAHVKGDKIYVFEVKGAKQLLKIKIPVGAIGPRAVDGDKGTLVFRNNRIIYYGGWDDLCRLDVHNAKADVILKGCEPRSLLVSKDGKRLYMGTNSGELRIYKIGVVPTKNSGQDEK